MLDCTPPSPPILMLTFPGCLFGAVSQSYLRIQHSMVVSSLAFFLPSLLSSSLFLIPPLSTSFLLACSLALSLALARSLSLPPSLSPSHTPGQLAATVRSTAIAHRTCSLSLSGSHSPLLPLFLFSHLPTQSLPISLFLPCLWISFSELFTSFQ